MFYAFSRKNKVFYKISGIDRYLSSCILIEQGNYFLEKAAELFDCFKSKCSAVVVALNMLLFFCFSECFSTECKGHVDKKEVRMDFSVYYFYSLRHEMTQHSSRNTTDYRNSSIQDKKLNSIGIASRQDISKLYRLQSQQPLYYSEHNFIAYLLLK